MVSQYSAYLLLPRDLQETDDKESLCCKRSSRLKIEELNMQICKELGDKENLVRSEAPSFSTSPEQKSGLRERLKSGLSGSYIAHGTQPPSGTAPATESTLDLCGSGWKAMILSEAPSFSTSPEQKSGLRDLMKSGLSGSYIAHGTQPPSGTAPATESTLDLSGNLQETDDKDSLYCKRSPRLKFEELNMQICKEHGDKENLVRESHGHDIKLKTVEEFVHIIREICPWVPEGGILEETAWNTIGEKNEQYAFHNNALPQTETLSAPLLAEPARPCSRNAISSPVAAFSPPASELDPLD
ncbi:hypothetical protein P7K49_005712 [Saguinus oedipus]|uniref:Beta-retroviral matrix protein domain-containing protein n=1 Tax=Saguinus oedipus TaxID=9490 RepID=A0ABQ9W153_SAGOE|nr:hypothetical protein P7K49_005712 [Saguinus oedipus]